MKRSIIIHKEIDERELFSVTEAVILHLRKLSIGTESPQTINGYRISHREKSIHVHKSKS